MKVVRKFTMNAYEYNKINYTEKFIKFSKLD